MEEGFWVLVLVANLCVKCLFVCLFGEFWGMGSWLQICV